MAKKLKKEINETVVKISVVDGTQGEMEFDFLSLPDEVQDKLGPFGLSHKLGDAAAGKNGPEAEEAIQKVFKGLMENNWSVRAPAAPKISAKDVAANLENFEGPEKEEALAILQKLGISIPGLS
jgi:hypothetical protein